MNTPSRPPAAQRNRKSFPVPVRVLRTGAVLLVTGIFIAGAACSSGYGSPCALGEGRLGIVCPLGFLGAAFASKSLLPGLWLAAGIAIVLVALLGRFFCAWVCPASLLQGLNPGPRRKGLRRPLAQRNDVPRLETNVEQAREKRNIYSSLAVLAGALGSSYLFGFPVFCLVCPIGLVFGTIYAVLHWFAGAQPGLELLIFPIILFAEFFLLRSWCSSICPLGALYGLIGGLSRLVRVRVKKEDCLATKGSHCRACEKACPQGVNLGELGGAAQTPSSQLCTKCLECWEKCPVGAVQVKWL